MYLILYLLYPNGKQQIIYIGACAKPLKVDWGHLYGLQWELALGGFAHMGPDVFCWCNDLYRTLKILKGSTKMKRSERLWICLKCLTSDSKCNNGLLVSFIRLLAN